MAKRCIPLKITKKQMEYYFNFKRKKKTRKKTPQDINTL